MLLPLVEEPDEPLPLSARAGAVIDRTGITATADMGTSAADWAAMNQAARAGRLNVRIMGYSAGLKPIETASPRRNTAAPAGFAQANESWV